MYIFLNKKKINLNPFSKKSTIIATLTNADRFTNSSKPSKNTTIITVVQKYFDWLEQSNSQTLKIDWWNSETTCYREIQEKIICT